MIGVGSLHTYIWHILDFDEAAKFFSDLFIRLFALLSPNRVVTGWLQTRVWRVFALAIMAQFHLNFWFLSGLDLGCKKAKSMTLMLK